MTSHHFPHPHHHPEYAPPVLRAASPASSVGTTYGPDQTSLSDSEEQLSQSAFERKWLSKLELDKPRQEEEEAEEDPLIPRPKSKEEEQAMVEKITKNLRKKIRHLEDDELFEQTLIRGSQIALETRPSTTEIDVLMKSMMGSSLTTSDGPVHRILGGAADDALTDGPWNKPKVYEGGVGMKSILGSVSMSATVKKKRGGKNRK